MVTPEISYRSATPQDMPSIISLVKSVRGDERRLDWRQFIIACDDTKVVGCIRTVQAEPDCKELASLVVMPEYRNKSIGTALVTKMLNKNTSRPLYLVCFRNKMGFYKKHDFQEANVRSIPKTLQRDFKRMTEDKGLALAVMELR